MRQTISILTLAAVLLTACAPAATPTDGGVGLAPSLAPTIAPTEAGVGLAPTVPPAPSAEPPTAAPAPTEAPTVAPQPTAMVIQDTRPMVDVFKVSDPTTVNLAAGAPQLVEFFAFW